MPFVTLAWGVPQEVRPIWAEFPVRVDPITGALAVRPVEARTLPTVPAEEVVRETYRHEGGIPAERRPALVARQIMSPHVITLPPAAAIAEAWDLFRRRRFRHVPIVTAEGAIVGMVSDRDLLGGARRGVAGDSAGPPVAVQDLMSHLVLTATADTEIRECARAMSSERVSALPIVDGAHRLVGILTTSDILRCLTQNAPVDLWA